ncbi:hypothetical protein JW960_14470 [candidate division KSB1 bacterium]|nr:hypothetical protein [candidate division KSB1 bacterium]
MDKQFRILQFIMLTLSLSLLNCSRAFNVFQQDDYPASELNAPELANKILVASRYSDFKEAVNEKLKEMFNDQPVYIKFIGLSNIENEDVKKYNAIIIINQCMGKQMDPAVTNFLNNYDDHNKIIVVTTSGAGGYKPEWEGRQFDVISSASKKAKVDEVTDQIAEKVNSLIN